MKELKGVLIFITGELGYDILKLDDSHMDTSLTGTAFYEQFLHERKRFLTQNECIRDIKALASSGGIDIMVFSDRFIQFYKELRHNRLVKYGILSYLIHDRRPQDPDFCIENHICDVIDEDSEWQIPGAGFDLLRLNRILFTPNIYVILGSSGSGKSTLMNHMLNYVPHLNGISKFTTRPKRQKGEQWTVCVGSDEFQQFVEERKIIGDRSDSRGINRYGYWAPDIEALYRNKDVIMETGSIDTALYFKKRFPMHAKIIALANSEKIIARNLLNRYSRTCSENAIREQGTRLDQIVRQIGIYERMIANSDFIIEEQPFPHRQASLRDYIAHCRPSSIQIK